MFSLLIMLLSESYHRFYEKTLIVFQQNFENIIQFSAKFNENIFVLIDLKVNKIYEIKINLIID